MIYPPRILDVLQQRDAIDWGGVVFRHMFGAYPPQRANTGGARWNPRGVPAIYASCERETALAEAEHQLAIQPVRPRVTRTLYRIQVSLSSVLDLTASNTLHELGIEEDALHALSFASCEAVGGAAAWLGHDGILVPSARSRAGINLVIFAQDPTAPVFHVLDSETLEAP